MKVIDEKPLALLVDIRSATPTSLAPGMGSSKMLGALGFCTALFIVLAHSASAQGSAVHTASVIEILSAWTPAILWSFLANIYISILSMILATILGVLVGVGLISEHRPIRWGCWCFTQFFRNAPWLVVLFYCMLVLPFSVRVGQFSFPLPDLWKAVLGIAIAAAANMAEVVRGAIQSIPTGQWESAASLAFSRGQIIRMIILPQCVKRMTPGWMNLYALVVVSTPLCAIVGVHEAMTSVAEMLAAYSRPELLIPAYFYLLLLFFIFCFPIAHMTHRLERRFAVVG